MIKILDFDREDDFDKWWNSKKLQEMRAKALEEKRLKESVLDAYG